MTDDQIERVVQRKTDNADFHFMRGVITEPEYRERMRGIASWADQQYKQQMKSERSSQ